MRLLLIHQNFPGQFKHLAPELVRRGHQVAALTPKVKARTDWKGVQVIPYRIGRGSTAGVHPWVGDFETKVIRAEACLRAAMALRDQGFAPDVILAHPAWGESLFLKDVWPESRLGLYCELYYLNEERFTNFDPEFPRAEMAFEAPRLRLKNINNRLHFDIGDAGISPTKFQAETFPQPFRNRISVIHDGIDTDVATRNAGAQLQIRDDLTLTRDDEVVTFINRNLEPYRGYHRFMRALPALLSRRPKAQVVILGGDDVSYGARPPQDRTWKQVYIDEVRGAIADRDWRRVHFLGRVPYERYLSVLQVSRVHVYLSYPFVVSWSLLEAMSVEAAIVASDTESVREVLQDGEMAHLVDFFDAEALVERVGKLLDDRAACKRMGRAARARIVENYDLRKVCLPRQIEWVQTLAAQTSNGPVA